MDLKQKALVLCCEIEKLPASEQQTKVSVMANELTDNMASKTTQEMFRKIFLECPITHEKQTILYVKGKETGLEHLEIVTEGITTSWKHTIHTEELKLQY